MDKITNEYSVSTEGAEDFSEWEWEHDSVSSISASAAEAVMEEISRDICAYIEVHDGNTYFEMWTFEHRVKFSTGFSQLIDEWIDTNIEVFPGPDKIEKTKIIIADMKSAIAKIEASLRGEGANADQA